jgi:hypothetical protein
VTSFGSLSSVASQTTVWGGGPGRDARRVAAGADTPLNLDPKKIGAMPQLLLRQKFRESERAKADDEELQKMSWKESQVHRPPKRISGESLPSKTQLSVSSSN